jgi:aminoglycoside phosphotransferase (APT) family kinase protein
VPVPTLVGIEEDPTWLDRPFFVMDEVTGCVADGTLLETSPYLERKAEIGRRKWTILGTIAKADAAAIGLVGPLAVPDGDAVWRGPLDYWEGVIDEDALSPQPVARAAIRWLRRNPPPPPAKMSVVHGDFRTGNFLFDAEGQVRAVLDWEMCHLGDPLEDLAWAFNPLWGAGSFEMPGRLVPRAEAIGLWEAASGLALDPEAFRWWEIFAGIKGIAIWQSAARVYADGSNRSPIQLAAGWFCTDPQDRHLMQMMGHPT